MGMEQKTKFTIDKSKCIYFLIQLIIIVIIIIIIVVKIMIYIYILKSL